jgi:hypothetical protein
VPTISSATRSPDYKAPFTLNVTTRQSTGEVLGYESEHNPVAKEPMAYLRTASRRATAVRFNDGIRVMLIPIGGLG